MSLIRLATLSCLILTMAFFVGCQNQTVVDNTTDVSNETDVVADSNAIAEVADETEDSTVLQVPKIAKAPASGFVFEEPVRIKAGDEFISVDSPGYACPTMADVDGDGLEDLVVGQFSEGHMRFCKNVSGSSSETPRFAKVDWIRTDGKKAKVPGVS